MQSRLLLLAALLFAGCETRSTPNSDKVRIAVGGRAALDFIPVYLASALGFFEEEGLQVVLQDVASTPKALQSLLGGSADVAAGGYDGAVQMSFEGKSIQAVALLERWPPLVLVGVPRPGRPLRVIADLKGAVVGVSSPGSSTHRFINYVLSRNGIAPSEIRTVGVGVNFSLAAAVQHGKVDAAVTGPLGMALLEKEPHLVTLVDCRTPEGAEATFGTRNLPSIALMTRRDWAREHPELLRRLGKATRRVLAWIHSHSAEDIAGAMPETYKGGDTNLYVRAVRNIRPAFSTDGVMPADGPGNVERFLKESGQIAGNGGINLAETYTNDFVLEK